MIRIAAFVLTILVSLPALADGIREIPDPALTPGEVASTDVREVCGIVGGLTYSKRHRLSQNPEMKRQVLARYGVPWSDRALVEDDHNAPLCAGGADTLANRWPQYRTGVIWTAADKDALEAETCREICHGRLPLAKGQARFLAPADWRVSFCAVFTDNKRCAR